MPNYLFIPDFQPEIGSTVNHIGSFEAQNQNQAEQDVYRKLKPGQSGKLYKELGPVSRPAEKARA